MEYPIKKKSNENLSAMDSVAIEEDITLEEMEKVLSTYSTSSSFEDDTWIIDKLNKDQARTNKQNSIYFSKVPESMRTNVKKYVLFDLNKGKKTGTVRFKVAKIAHGLTASGKQNIEDIEPKDILKIHNYIFVNDRNIKTNLEEWITLRNFFKECHYYDQYNTMIKYILPPFPDKEKIDYKYIPDEVALQLDVIMKTDLIDHARKTIYWLLRLIPNRVTEVASMTVNCLKQIDESNYVLSIPTFKQSGRYATGAVKLIQIEYTGMGAYLIDLIKEQINAAKENNTEDHGNFLFCGPTYGFFLNTETQQYYSKIQNRNIKNISIDNIQYFLKRACTCFNVRDSDGKPYIVTTHQFRHNAISDRLNSGIFRSIDIVGLTAHHNLRMIEQSYSHVTDEMLLENREILFRGRIINTDNPLKEKQILRKPFANRIHNLGLCSDIRGCSNSRFRCMRCKYMIPDIESLSFCESERDSWNQKYEKAINIGNQDYADLCKYNAESYEIVIEKIASAVSDEVKTNEISEAKEVTA